jgi:hypothetical protein
VQFCEFLLLEVELLDTFYLALVVNVCAIGLSFYLHASKLDYRDHATLKMIQIRSNLI